MPIRLTLAEVKAELQKISPTIRICTKYRSNKVPLGCLCLRCGYKWQNSWTHLRDGQGCPQCAGILRPTAKEIGSAARKLGIIVIGKYCNNRVPIKCGCLRCCHIWNPTWTHLSQGHGCPKCGGSLQLSTKEVRAKLRKLNPRIEIISEYNDSGSPLKCRCSVCKHTWKTTWNCLNQGRGCPVCSRKRASDKRLFTIDFINKRLRQANLGVVVSGEYLGAHVPLQCQCLQCRHKWFRSWNDLKSSKGCLRCWKAKQTVRQRLTLSEVKRRLRGINPTIEVVGDYYGHKPPLKLDSEVQPMQPRRSGKRRRNRKWIKCQCLQCNHSWFSSWDSVYYLKTGCPQCRILKSEEEVRSTLEKLTGLKWPRANPLEVPWLHGLTLDGYCREWKSVKFPNGTAYERQGEQHYKLTYLNQWNLKVLCRQRQRDARKKMQCWRHGVRLIRIPYWIKDVDAYLKQRLKLDA